MMRITVHERDKAPRVVLIERFPAAIGRGDKNAVVLAGWSVGRVHAEIHKLGAHSFKLIDKGTLSGTWVNSERVVEYGPLSEDDEIVIGGFRLQLQVPLSPRVQSLADASRPGAVAALSASVSRPRSLVASDAGTAHAASPPTSIAEAPTQSRLPSEMPARVEQPSDRDVTSYLAGFEWRRTLHRMLLETVDLRRKDVRGLDDTALRAETEAIIRELLAARIKLPAEVDPDELVRDVLDEVVGLGPLERMLADASITEVMVNGSDEIFVERLGKLERCRAAFTSDEAVRQVIDRIVAPLGRRIDESSPMVDARLKDGSRVNAIIPPLALRGPTITIRKFNRRVFEVADYIGLGSASAAMFDFLRVCVENRKNIVVAGGTGSGKTTLLNILSNLIPRGERIITIEDAAELRLNHPHLVSLEARPANMEGRGAIAIRDLVRNSLRMRPDRIVVGECRGGEALDMLQAMNTGHDGSLTTVHANSPRDVISRLEVMTLMAGMDIPVVAIREQVAAAVDVIVQQSRMSDGTRRITSISEVTGVENGTVQLQQLFEFRRVGFSTDGRILGYYTGCNAVPTFYEELRRMGVEVELSVFDELKEERHERRA
jgi:pilus assembly protein CpaF